MCGASVGVQRCDVAHGEISIGQASVSVCLHQSQYVLIADAVCRMPLLSWAANPETTLPKYRLRQAISSRPELPAKLVCPMTRNLRSQALRWCLSAHTGLPNRAGAAGRNQGHAGCEFREQSQRSRDQEGGFSPETQTVHVGVGQHLDHFMHRRLFHPVVLSDAQMK